MAGLTSGLNIGLSGVVASQSALNTIGHNIANVNTVGYSRQRVTFATTSPQYYGNMLFGSGVNIQEVRSIRSRFLDMQINTASSRKAGSEERYAGIEGISGAFTETDESGISLLLNRFLQGFQDLSARPEDLSLRRSVIGQATSFINGMKERYRLLEDGRSVADKEITGTLVPEVNSLTQQIAALNLRISGEPTPGSDNDGRDERKVLADRLATLVGVQVYEDNTGQLQITLDNGSAPLVAGAISYRLSTTPDPALNNFARINVTVGGVVINASASIKEGTIGAKLDLRDNILANYQRHLDQLAAGVASNTNLLHRAGYALDGTTTGNDFFRGAAANGANGLPPAITAANSYLGMVNFLQVNTVIDANPSLLAAAVLVPPAVTASPGNNQNARAIANLQFAANTVDTNADGIGDTGPFSSYIGSLESLIGVEGQNYQDRSVTDDNLLTGLEVQRDQISGVDLDEEATNLIAYQRAYQASARFMSVISQLTDLLVNQIAQ